MALLGLLVGSLVGFDAGPRIGFTRGFNEGERALLEARAELAVRAALSAAPEPPSARLGKSARPADTGGVGSRSLGVRKVEIYTPMMTTKAVKGMHVLSEGPT